MSGARGQGGQPIAASGRGLRPELPRLTRRSLVVWRRNWTAWVKYYRTSTLLNFGEPLLHLLALGFGLGAFVSRIDGVSFLAFIAPGMMAATAMNAVTFDMAWEGYERTRVTGLYDAYLATPLTIPEIVAGELLWEAARSLFYGLIFLLLIALFGLIASPWTALVPLLLLVTGVLFAAPALAVAATARVTDHLFYYFSLAVTPMFLFSGVFFPVSSLPEPLQALIVLLPLYHAVELARAMVLGGLGPEHLVHAAWLLGIAFVLCLLPVPLLRRALER